MKPLGVGAAGRIPTEAAAEPGRSVGRLTDLGWGTTLRQLLTGDAPDEPVPDDLFDAVVQVLTGWDWAQRPAAVVTMPSRTRPIMIGALGQRIATTGRLGYLGSLGYTGEGPGRQHNSAQRLAALWRELTVPDALRAAVAGGGVVGSGLAVGGSGLAERGPVLLVDDRVDTGWTMTVAAKLLREAGAPAVLPFALAVTT
jgi:ATP-dependent DNA helicase RecQ